ncbi:MAG: T9SS type A sorting domain-containing protein [candidate division WOR-3 bacterium]
MLRFILLTLATLPLTLGTTFAQDTIWVRQYDLGSDEQLIGVASRGDKIIGVGNYTDPSNYDAEGLAVVFNQSGDTLQTGTIDFEGDEVLMDAFIDQDMNYYVAGNGRIGEKTSLRPLDFIKDFKPQEINYSIIMKADSSGILKWGIIDTPYAAIGVVVDSSGNCYATGYRGSFSTGTDLAIVKINPDGDTAWVRRFDTNFLESFYRCAIDHFGNIVTSGFALDFLTFTFKGILAKVKPDGETLWLKTFSLDSFTALVGVDVDKDGNVITTGFCGTSKNIDFLVLKTDSMGETLWTRRFDYTEDDEGLGVVCDSEGYIFATGYFADGDCRLLKISPDGELIWSYRYDHGGYEHFQDITIDESGYPICVGFTDFSQTPYDLLIAKFSPITGIAERQKTVFGHRSSVILLPGELVFDVPVAGRYRIDIFDLLGKRVSGTIEHKLNPGRNYIPLNPLASGIYIIRTTGPGQKTETYKAIMAK